MTPLQRFACIICATRAFAVLYAAFTPRIKRFPGAYSVFAAVFTLSRVFSFFARCRVLALILPPFPKYRGSYPDANW